MGKGWKWMAIVGGIFLFLHGLLMIGISSGLLNADLLTTQEFPRDIAWDTRLIIGGVGLVFLVISVLSAKTALDNRRNKSILPCGPRDQGVQVTLACVRDGLQGVASQLPEVSWLAPEIEWRGKVPSLLVRVGLKPTDSVRDSASRLQTMVRRYIDEVLGLVELGEVRIIIEKIDVWSPPEVVDR